MCVCVCEREREREREREEREREREVFGQMVGRTGREKKVNREKNWVFAFRILKKNQRMES